MVLFWLLGYQFSPRLAGAGESVFWRVDKEANYGVLNDLSRSCANPQKIEHHWEDMMRIAGSLKLGTVQASELIHRIWTNGLSVHFRSVGLQTPISS